MMAGRPLVVTGVLNKIVAQSIRVSPRRVVTRIVRAINESR
jgi:hypothetical protein